MKNNVWVLAVAFLFSSCNNEDDLELIDINVEGFPVIPESELPTKVGAKLGKELFYDPLFSGNGEMSCASCHQASAAFSDKEKRFSVGINGLEGGRNASAIINPAWGRHFFWDGRARSLEEQAGQPVENIVELNHNWELVLEAIKTKDVYVDMFSERFPSEQNITRVMVETVIAEFEKTMVSSNAKYDQYRRGELNLSTIELQGMELFFSEEGECFHCHGMPLFTDHRFHNNGLDSVFLDPGRAEVTGMATDLGLFLTPTLRNVALTAPYMHDGRFETLQEVIEFYSTGVHFSNTIDPLIIGRSSGGAHFSAEQKEALLAFLKTLTDSDFITNPSLIESN